MTTVKLLRVVIASPNDVQEERKALDAVIADFNHVIAEDSGFILKIKSWEKVAYPGFHSGGPQALIDSVLNIEDCDIFIGVLWRRFGTPITEDGETGTEHDN